MDFIPSMTSKVKKAKSDAKAAIDGTWTHENGSDAWDGSAPGEKGKGS